MSAIVWGWAAAWLIGRMWLEWRVDRSWLPGTAEIREDYRFGVPRLAAVGGGLAHLTQLHGRW
jgi:hypothetical protein